MLIFHGIFHGHLVGHIADIAVRSVIRPTEDGGQAADEQFQQFRWELGTERYQGDFFLSQRCHKSWGVPQIIQDHLEVS